MVVSLMWFAKFGSLTTPMSLTFSLHVMALISCLLVFLMPGFTLLPVVVSTSGTKVLGHHQHSWESLKSVVDLCAGFGGLAQGAMAAGFNVQVAVDQNQKMLDLHAKASGAHTICGDIGSQDVACDIWKHSGGAGTFTCGFSCQPFSRLCDCKSHEDVRANCLTKALKTSYYLNAQVIVLECVAPASQDGFVKEELAHFSKHTGYHCTLTDLKLDDIWPCRLKLDDIWPCRRHRAWWVLTSPDVGNLPGQSSMMFRKFHM
jgi:predicted RNA methylase